MAVDDANILEALQKSTSAQVIVVECVGNRIDEDGLEKYYHVGVQYWKSDILYPKYVYFKMRTWNNKGQQGWHFGPDVEQAARYDKENEAIVVADNVCKIISESVIGMKKI